MKPHETLCLCGCGDPAPIGKRFKYSHHFKTGARLGRWGMKTRDERFWKKVKKTEGCWMWLGGGAGDGYGSFDQKRAHRVSWEIHNGKIPKGSSVCHRCDTPMCVRPDHLFLGTPGQNSRDMVAKGRSARGVKQHSAKMTPEIVMKIRALYKTNEFSMKDVAAKLGVSMWAVYDVLRGKSWRWL